MSLVKEGAFYFEFQALQWPPKASERLHRIEQDGATVELVCFPDGHLALVLASNGEARKYHFQRVSIESGRLVKFAFSWNRASASAAAGGALLLPLAESQGRVLDLKLMEKMTYEMGQLSVPEDALRNASRDEWLFVHSLGDMTEKLTRASRYDLIRLSALLRQLLCDSPPLALEVNRTFKLNVMFEVGIKNAQTIAESDALVTAWRTLYPLTQAEATGVDLGRFLRLQTITHAGVVCTVKDVIGVVAHAFGGVHYGQLWDDGNRALAILEKEVLVRDVSMVMHSLHDIGMVTVKALMPLAQAILDRGSGKGGAGEPPAGACGNRV